jgi:FtsP/CotA-like multicopper oxidase with cupredoxin domain
MQRGQREFWRLGNVSADTILDLQVLYDGTPQTLSLVSLDGVPVGSQDGTHPGGLIPITDLLLPPAGRMEFILTGPSSAVRSAQFATQAINTGPDGDNDTARTLATIVGGATGDGTGSVPGMSGPQGQPLFPDLATVPVNRQRQLYFSENADQTQFYITVDGQTPTVFSPDNPPAVVTTQGSVEDWIVENRALEDHEFHIHQLHFLVLSQDNFQINGSQPVAAIQNQFLDTVQIPYWDGNPAHPFPRVRLRMDFRGRISGDFVYHCHILGHEDLGMMAVIRVLPAQ